MVGSLASHNLPKLHILLRRGSQARLSHHYGLPFVAPLLNRTSPKRQSVAAHEHRFCFPPNQGTPMSKVEGDEVPNRIKEKESNLQPLAAAHVQKPSIPIWTRWVLGTILSLILPLLKIKKEELLTLEVEVDKIAEVIQNVAEVVEKVAVVAEKVSSEVADKLPDDGKLKDTVMLVEHVSKEVAKDAQLTLDFIHKVDEVKQQLETFLGPVIDHQNLNIPDD